MIFYLFYNKKFHDIFYKEFYYLFNIIINYFIVLIKIVYIVFFILFIFSELINCQIIKNIILFCFSSIS